MKALYALLALSLALAGCRSTAGPGMVITDGGTDVDTDSDTDTDTDSDTDSDTDTDTQDTDSEIPETCEEAEQTATTVGCLFYAVDLDSHDSVETQQYAVVISNVHQTETATVSVYKGNGTGWDEPDTVEVDPMSLHQFDLPDYHMNSSGVMPKGSFRVESDVPIVAYQFNPVDGASSYLSDASVLIPATSLGLSYEVVGWKQCQGDGDMRAYFSVIATQDGTLVTVEPSVSPLADGVVPSGTSPFTVDMDEGDVLEVETNGVGDSLSGSRITANEGHPIAVFSGQECAFIPETIYACDHLEEQIPAVAYWGEEIVAARMPVRSTAAETEDVLWQIYASEDGTEVTLSASGEVEGLPFESATLEQGELLEFYVHGTQESPGDFFVQADEPIAVMQYMIGSANPNCDATGDPAMVYTTPTEQFLPRYVLLVPGTWNNDALIVTRHTAQPVLLDGALLPDEEFVEVADSGYEVARVAIDDGIHTLTSEDDAYGLAVIVVGYDDYDSYAYAGGMAMGEINP
jgi:hypothetical protein